MGYKFYGIISDNNMTRYQKLLVVSGGLINRTHKTGLLHSRAESCLVLSRWLAAALSASATAADRPPPVAQVTNDHLAMPTIQRSTEELNKNLV